MTIREIPVLAWEVSNEFERLTSPLPLEDVGHLRALIGENLDRLGELNPSRHRIGVLFHCHSHWARERYHRFDNASLVCTSGDLGANSRKVDFLVVTWCIDTPAMIKVYDTDDDLNCFEIDGEAVEGHVSDEQISSYFLVGLTLGRDRQTRPHRNTHVFGGLTTIDGYPFSSLSPEALELGENDIVWVVDVEGDHPWLPDSFCTSGAVRNVVVGNGDSAEQRCYIAVSSKGERGTIYGESADQLGFRLNLLGDRTKLDIEAA